VTVNSKLGVVKKINLTSFVKYPDVFLRLLKSTEGF